MEENKTSLIIGFTLVGLVLIGLSIFMSVRKTETSETQYRLARVDRESGSVFILRKGYTQKEKVDLRGAAFNLDTVETDDTGDALLSFESSYRLRMLPQTLLTLEQVQDQDDFHIVAILKRGEIKIENFGKEGELFIAKNGERVSASDYNGSELARVITEPISTNDTTPSVSAESPLTDQEISQVVGNHRTSFFKCYTQLLQKDPAAKGDVSLSFTIQNSGKISTTEINTNALNNDDFKKCLIEVLRRIEFRSFSGPAISTLFPLKFE